jgi:hypothetical protein
MWLIALNASSLLIWKADNNASEIPNLNCALKLLF